VGPDGSARSGDQSLTRQPLPMFLQCAWLLHAPQRQVQPPTRLTSGTPMVFISSVPTRCGLVYNDSWLAGAVSVTRPSPGAAVRSAGYRR
jgi:hypothetical protein